MSYREKLKAHVQKDINMIETFIEMEKSIGESEMTELLEPPLLVAKEILENADDLTEEEAKEKLEFFEEIEKSRGR